MPYVGATRRVVMNVELDPLLKQIDAGVAEQWITEGDLNYILSRIILRYLGKKPNYARYNQVLGVLTAIPLELYRRKIAPYEDTKIGSTENGDLPEFMSDQSQ